MTVPPPEKLDAQVVDMQRCLAFQFLTSLLRFGSGWFANHALQRTAGAASVRCWTVYGPPSLSFCR